MATKYPFDEYVKVSWVPGADGIAAIDEPELWEIQTGTDITCELTADGLALGVGTNAIDSASLCSRVSAQIPGRITFNGVLTGFRYKQPDAEPLWDLAVLDSEGFLVVRRGKDQAGAFALGDTVQVFKATFGARSDTDTSTDTLATFAVPLYISDYNDDAAIVELASA